MTRSPDPAAAQPPAPAAGSAGSLALLYCPAALRRDFTLLLALEAEIGAGLSRALDHALAHARLDWWREEAARYAQGAPRHPWLRAHAAQRPRWDLTALIDAALVDLAEGRSATPRPRHLRGALFCIAAADLEGRALTAAAHSALAELGALHAELEPAAAGAAQEVRVRLRAAIAGLAAPCQRTWAPLLVWCTLAARQSTRPGARSGLAEFADNIAAWRAARAAAAGRLCIGT